MSSTRQALPLILTGLALVLFATAVVGEGADQKDWEKAAQVPPNVPAAEKNRENPFAWNADARKLGKNYFSSQCTMCHGAEGRGDGDLVERLKLVTIPDFADQEFQDKWTDGAMYYVIQSGHGAMPSQKERFDAEIKWGMVNYVRSLGKSD
jgi:mono/diheme cytochrome c family protein